MFPFVKKIIPALIFWGIFGYVVFYIPYPQTITQANLFQILVFLISLFLAISLTLNIFLSFILLSSSVTLGIIFLLIFKALDSLNIVTSILTLIAVGLLFSYFRKAKRTGSSINSGFKNLTKISKIPKLTNMRKHHSSS